MDACVRDREKRGRASIHPFDADTQVGALTDHRFSAVISNRWNTLGGRAFGGYGLAICLQALRREMPLPDPLAVSAYFLRPTIPGPAEVHVEPVRSGRRLAFGEARLLQDGTEVLRALASFTTLGQAGGRTLVLNGRPHLPPPDDCVDLAASLPGVTVSDRIECRGPELPGWLRGQPTGNARATFWMRFREPRDADLFAVPLLVDAAAPTVLELGEAGSVTIELSVHLRAHPAPGWLSCRAVTRYLIDGYHEEDFEIWDAEGKLVAQSRQLALLPVQAIAPRA
jgi:acyl-CoA thioesterase